MSGGRFQIEDEEFWSDPWKNLPAVASAQMGGQVSGIVLDCPEKVNIASHARLPVLIYHSGRTIALWHAPFFNHAVIAAMRLSDGAVFANTVVAPDGTEPPSGQPPTPGFVGKPYLLELRSSVALPWQPGEYIVSALYREQMSDLCRFKLMRSDNAGYVDPAVAEFLAARQRRMPLPPAPAVWPPLPMEPVDLIAIPPQSASDSGENAHAGDAPVAEQRTALVPPYYRTGADVPPVPTEPGIKMAATRVAVARPDSQCILHGSFCLPVRRRFFVERGDIGTLPDVGAPGATAVVPITLIILSSKGRSAAMVPLRVATYDPVDSTKETAIVTGSFSIDLLALDQMPRAAATYFIYAFGGESVSGPTIAALVTEEMLQEA